MSGDKSITDDVQAALGRVAAAIGRAVLAVDGVVAELLGRIEPLTAGGPGASSFDGAVLGVDACRAGWVGVVLEGEAASVLVAATIDDLVTAARLAHPTLAVVGVDIPIGLPDSAPRRADLLARGRLPSGRKSSVFRRPPGRPARRPVIRRPPPPVAPPREWG